MSASATIEPPLKQAEVGCWGVFWGIHTRAERARECRYRFDERLAILLEDKDKLPADEQVELAVAEMRAMEWKMKVWWI